MELDKRIKEGKRPLTCFDVKEARQFIGKECYFSNHLCTFNELLDAYSYVTADMLVSKEKHLYVGELLTVSDSDGSCYEAGINGEAEWFQFCLPCEWIEEKKEPKYREYKDLDEFFDVTGLEIGDLIKLKFPGNNVAELLIVGSCDNSLFIGIHKYTFKQLFEMVEISISGEWKPFGIEE